MLRKKDPKKKRRRRYREEDIYYWENRHLSSKIEVGLKRLEARKGTVKKKTKNK